MLKPTSLIMGAGLGLDVACLTDGRFSGGFVGIFALHMKSFEWLMVSPPLAPTDFVLAM